MLMYNHQPPCAVATLFSQITKLARLIHKCDIPIIRQIDAKDLITGYSTCKMVNITCCTLKAMPEIVIGYRSVILAYGQQPSC